MEPTSPPSACVSDPLSCLRGQREGGSNLLNLQRPLEERQELVYSVEEKSQFQTYLKEFLTTYLHDALQFTMIFYIFALV